MYVLVDTSIWIDHFKKQNSHLISLLEQQVVLVHSAVIGEFACGRIKNRREIMEYFKMLRQANEAQPDEVLEMIERRSLYGRGLNWVDMQLLASASLSDAQLWTADKNMQKFC